MGTTKIPLCTADIRRELKSKVTLKNTALPKDTKFALYLEVSDELAKKIELDAVLAGKIFRDVSKIYKEAVGDLAKLATDIDDSFLKPPLKSADYPKKEWAKRAPDIFAEAEAKMLVQAKKHIQKWQQVRKDRTKYVVKASAKVTVGTLGVATATLGTVISSAGVATTGGAAIPGLVAAIYVNAKAIVQLGKVINRLRRDVDAAEKDLRNDLETIYKAYMKNCKAAVVSKELGKAAIEQFLATTMPSISSAENGLSDFKGKLDGIDIKLSEMAISLNTILDQQLELQKKIAAKKKTLQQGKYKSKKLPKLEASVDKLAVEVNRLLAEIPEADTKIAKGRKRYNTKYKPMIKALKAKKPGWVDYAQMSMKLGDLALGAAFTDFGAADSVLVLVDSIGTEADDVLVEKLL